ncbi:MAG: ROK family protein [Sphaerochaeta sp.]|jgi:glucokinase|nr:ROK family protein [Sphaerochaeta sp.]
MRALIGIDIGGTKTAVSLGRDDGSIIDKIAFATEAVVEEVLSSIYSAVDELVIRHGAVISAIGISCGGPLDSKRGIIQSPPNLPAWKDIPIVELVQSRFGAPTFLENDANACALAEWYWGAGRGFESIIFLTFGTGLGAGLILDGRLYRGPSGLAGEVGHWRMAPDGPLCYYKKGSFESFASGCGISGLYEQHWGERLSAKDVCARAEAGEAKALGVINESAQMLGSGLSLLVDVLNPERIIIGSIFARSEHLFRPLMDEVMKGECLPLSLSICEVVPSALGEHLGDMAALGIARDHMIVEA